MRLIAAASVLAVVSANVNLYHRVFHPSQRDLPYAHRASISFPRDSNPIMVPSPHLYDSLVSFSELLGTLQNTDGALYQLALEHEGDTSNALWDISSVKIVCLAVIYISSLTPHTLYQCHLDKASSETLILHLLNAQDYNPFALDYFVSPIPHDGSCREPHISKKGPSPSISLQNFADKIQHLNSTIHLRRPDSPPLYVPKFIHLLRYIQHILYRPELHAPPPLTPQGEVVQPVPEKSFLQKYWMYIAALLLIFCMSFMGSSPSLNSIFFSSPVLVGGDDEQPRRAQ
jgi:hypothetical protein